MAGTRAKSQQRPFADTDAGRPLTEREKQQIVRLLSEPMEFPMEYRTWIKNFVETVGIQLPRSSIVGLKSATVTTAFEVLRQQQPPGTLLLGLWREPPPGTVFANGATLARDEYPLLADVLGVHRVHDEFELPRIYAPDGQRWAIVTGNRPRVVRESEES